MDIQQLRYFARTAKYGSFREAAQTLFITRAALSKSIAQLESELGYDLFERIHEGVKLTDAGRRFCERANVLVLAFDQLEADMKHDREVLDVVVCFPNSWYEFFADKLRAFEAAHRGRIRVIVECGTDADLVGRIKDGKAHVAVTHLPVEGMLDAGMPLARSPLYIAMSAHNPLAARASVTAADMVDQNVMYYACGFERVFWAPVFESLTSSFSNDLMHIYARIFKNEGVLPTPLFTTPQFQCDIEYRPFNDPATDTDIVTYGYISPYVEGNQQLKEACLLLREALLSM